MNNILRKAMLPVLAAVTIGAATPVLAADVYVGERYVREAPMVQGPFTLQQALVVAQQVGVVTVSNTNFDGDQWEIEGRDFNGKYIEVDVDARTGEIRDVDRSII